MEKIGNITASLGVATYPEHSDDLEELLVGGAYAVQSTMAGTTFPISAISTELNGVYFPGLHVMDDDVEAAVYGQENDGEPYHLLGAFYRWAEDPCNDGSKEYDDPTWGSLYSHIGVTNAVLDKVEEFTQDSLSRRNAIKGQSYFIRAASYFMLVNLYAKTYDPATSENDLGVPLKTDAVVHDIEYSRTPVDSVYAQIVSDLKDAITYLEGYAAPNKRHATLDAAKLLLSRV